MTTASVPASAPLRRDPTVIAGFITSTASVIVGAISLLGTLLTAQQHSSPVPGQLSKCLAVAEGYRNEISHDPAMYPVLRAVVLRDPEARQCGIGPSSLHEMLLTN